MKRLHLLRHAKSSWDDPTLADHDRPLTKRGRRASKLIGDHLRTERIHPPLVLCSSSRRTTETMERIGSAIGDAEIRVEEGLYGAQSRALLERLRRIPEEFDSVLLIGHNPGVRDLALELSEGGADTGEIQAKFPTAALAALKFDGAWRDLAPGGCSLLAFVKPRELERRR